MAKSTKMMICRVSEMNSAHMKVSKKQFSEKVQAKINTL